jgi:mycothione reductase
MNTAMGHALGYGFVMFLADKTNGKILGCHIIGSEAPILIHEVLVVMRPDDNGGTIDNIIKTVHPALSEVVARAAADIRRI